METGVIGHHGEAAVLLVGMELKAEKETATIHRLAQEVILA